MIIITSSTSALLPWAWFTSRYRNEIFIYFHNSAESRIQDAERCEAKWISIMLFKWIQHRYISSLWSRQFIMNCSFFASAIIKQWWHKTASIMHNAMCIHFIEMREEEEEEEEDYSRNALDFILRSLSKGLRISILFSELNSTEREMKLRLLFSLS